MGSRGAKWFDATVGASTEAKAHPTAEGGGLPGKRRRGKRLVGHGGRGPWALLGLKIGLN